MGEIEKRSAVTADSGWSSLYKLGGAAALVIVLVILSDIIISFLPGGGNPGVGTLTVIDWFTTFQAHPLFGLRHLGLFNIINNTLAIPMFLALYAAHQQTNRTFAALALILFLVGTAVYISNNAAVPMLVLSGKYAAAGDTQRALLAAAGETILARGEDFTPGAFIGFLLPNIAAITISFVMLYGRIFSRSTAYIGILGLVLLLIFTVWTTFFPALSDSIMILAMVGGLLSMSWYILIARRLFHLGKSSD